MSGSWPSSASVTASSAAACAFGSIVVVTCRPSVFSVCSSDVEQLEQFLLHLALDQPVRARRLVLVPGLIRRHGRRKHLRRTVGRRERADLDHAVEHPVPPRNRAVRVDRRVQRGGPLDERGQQRTVGDGELFDRLVEVRLGRGADTVRAATEVDDVQIGLQHLVFGPFAGHLRRDDQLLGLADDAAQPGSRRAHQRVLDVLLGDRRPALGVTSPKMLFFAALREAGEREAGVGVEVAVFGGHHRVRARARVSGRC